MKKIKLDSKPLHEKACEELLDLIRESKVGYRLPSEENLSKSLGISRNTLREALKILSSEGWIVQKQGVGTFVRRESNNRIENGMEILESINSISKRKNLDLEVEDLSIALKVPDKEVRNKLITGESERVTEVSRVLNISGNRVAYLVDYVPESVIPFEELKKEIQCSVIDYIIARGQPIIDYAFTEFEPFNISDELAAKIKLDKSQSILLLKETLISTSGIPIEYGLNYLISSFFDFHVVRKIRYH